MTKIFSKILIFLAFLVCFKAYAQAEKPAVYVNYLSINEDSKKIKDSKISRYIMISGTQDTVAVRSFDQYGNILSETLLNPDTTKTERSYFSYTYKYDSFGKLIEKIDSSERPVKRIVLSYDDNGNISKEESYVSKSKINREASYEYDMLQRLTESTETDNTLDRKIHTFYIYDSYNNVTKLSGTISGATDKKFETTFVYKYDSKYHILEKQTINNGGNNKTETFKYDAKGNLIQGYDIPNRDNYIEYIYTYDNSNHRIKIEKTEINVDKKTTYSEDLKYDAHGNITEDSYTGSNGEVIAVHKYYYEYYN